MTTATTGVRTERSIRSRAGKDGKNTFKTTRIRLTSRGATIGAIVIAFVWTIPTFGVFVSSFRPPADINTSGWWTVFTNPQLTIQNYVSAINFDDGGISVGGSVINSLAISIPASIIPIVIAALAAYGLAWINFRGRNIVFVCIFALQIVPLQLALVPLLSLYSNGVAAFGVQIIPALNLSSTTASFAEVWISHTIFAMPLAIFLLHNSIASLPRELVEAARVDGAGHGQIFFRVVLPLALPSMAAFGIFQFLWVWNDLLVATIFTSGQNAPVTKVLTDLSGTYGQQWYLLTAGTFLAIAVPLVVFFSLQRFFVRGLLAGATKG